MKPTLILLLIASILLITGCSSSVYDSGEGTKLKREMEFRALGIVIDKETGCQYIMQIDSGITPRLESDGKVMGCKVKP
jgi:protein involved in sex pheromone biosynthesis